MQVGVVVPQGWTGEYDGWQSELAWARTVAVAQQAERLGFESIWLFDHFQTVPRPTDEITFESFTTLAALAALTSRVRLGHIVICSPFRNPALTAKMISTMDVISGGRMELGIGAGWKRDEWLAYGYGFPETRERLAILADHLEVITRMLEPGRDAHATWEGTHASVRNAINVPKPIQQPRVPIMVGGNGPQVTWRLAARHADELNLDGMSPDELAEALPVIRSRCEEIDRDPASLRISVHLWWGRAGQQRVDEMGRFRELGVSRVMELVRDSVTSDEALERYAEDAREAGVSFDGPEPAPAPAPVAGPAAACTVVLVDTANSRVDPARRTALIQAIQELTGQSGWRASRTVDKAPRVVAEGVPPVEADRIRRTLEALGATVELR